MNETKKKLTTIILAILIISSMQVEFARAGAIDNTIDTTANAIDTAITGSLMVTTDTIIAVKDGIEEAGDRINNYPTPPSADFSWEPSNPALGSNGYVQVEFDGGDSYPGKNTVIVDYMWDWDNDGVVEQRTSYNKITKEFTTKGEKAVRLKVLNERGESDETVKRLYVADTTSDSDDDSSDDSDDDTSNYPGWGWIKDNVMTLISNAIEGLKNSIMVSVKNFILNAINSVLGVLETRLAMLVMAPFNALIGFIEGTFESLRQSYINEWTVTLGAFALPMFAFVWGVNMWIIAWLSKRAYELL